MTRTPAQERAAQLVAAIASVVITALVVVAVLAARAGGASW